MGSPEVTLTELQCVFVRNLLFVELHSLAKALAEKAHGAHEGQLGETNVDGEDAHGLYLQLRIIAELLDIVGWPVRKDAATMNEHIDVLRRRGPLDPEGVE